MMKEDFEEMFLVYDLVKDIYVVKLMSIYDILYFSIAATNKNK